MITTLKTEEELCPICAGKGTRVAAMGVTRKHDWIHADWDSAEMITEAQVLACPGCLGTGHMGDAIRRKFSGEIEWFAVGTKDDNEFRTQSLALRARYQAKHANTPSK